MIQLLLLSGYLNVTTVKIKKGLAGNMDFVSELSFNKTFSQLAKESNFTFNLYRGRVDWKKIGE